MRCFGIYGQRTAGAADQPARAFFNTGNRKHTQFNVRVLFQNGIYGPRAALPHGCLACGKLVQSLVIAQAQHIGSDAPFFDHPAPFLHIRRPHICQFCFAAVELFIEFLIGRIRIEFIIHQTNALLHHRLPRLGTHNLGLDSLIRQIFMQLYERIPRFGNLHACLTEQSLVVKNALIPALQGMRIDLTVHRIGRKPCLGISAGGVFSRQIHQISGVRQKARFAAHFDDIRTLPGLKLRIQHIIEVIQ